MNKIFASIILSLTMCMCFAQHDHHDRNHSDHHHNTQSNFTQSKQFTQHHWSKNLKHQHDVVLRYIRDNNARLLLNLNFSIFDCNGYVPIWNSDFYPNYYNDGVLAFPEIHRVWFDCPRFHRGFVVEAIAPLDIIVFQTGDWMYMRDYYRICVEINL